MAESDELPGRVVRIDRNFANISVSGRAGNARLDRSVAGRITGSYIDDVRDILEMNAQVKVRIVPMSEEALSKFPQRIRMTVRRNSQWEVKFFRRDIEPAAAPQVSQFNVPEKTLEKQSPSTTGKTIQTAAASATGASATGSSATGSSATGSSATGASATGASATGASATGASATGASAAGSSATGSSASSSSAAAGSATGGPVDFKDVLSQTEIIDSVEDCNRVLDPILDQSTRETVVIGLDCQGVNLGK
eukprot:XP_011677415.1 PREDICTED: ankyrin repeat domain-containing protein 24-like [Strongylocentrotus purpuratus]